MINSDSLEQIQDANETSTQVSVESYILIIPDSFEHSNERKEKISEDSRISSAPLSMETCSMTNSDSLKKVTV